VTNLKKIEMYGLETIPIVKEGDNVAKLIVEAATREGIDIQEGDIIVIAQTIISRSEGRIVDLKDIKPSPFAEILAKETGKDPRLVEVILRESKGIVRMGGHHLIMETHHGFICANSGVDRSNVPGEETVSLLPLDPDASARKIRDEIKKLTGKDVAVIISDTFGRPLREGAIGVAIGVAGIDPLYDMRGKKDLFGYELKTTLIAIADELASAAELLMGESDEGIPVVIVRGFKYPKGEYSIKRLLRPVEKDLFR